MTRLIQSLAEISDNYDALFVDLWGCLHNGVRPFPEAVDALRTYKKGGGRVLLLTNAPRPKPSVIAQLDRLGVPREIWDDIVSSGDAAQAAMLSGAVGRRLYHIGPEKDDGFFTEIAPDLLDLGQVTRVGLDDAEGIVCTGPFHEETEKPQDYRATFLAAKARGLKLLCANPDIVVDMGDRRIYCAGALAAYYTEMGGESLYFGKPYPPIYDLARHRLAGLAQVAPDRILAIGDGIRTDIKGALGEDIDSLFLTAGLAAAETMTEGAPDPAKIAAFLQAEGVTPTFTMGALN